MNSIKERLQLFLQEQNISASEFADTIGVQRSSVSHILAERNKPSIDFLQKMLRAYPDLDVSWLLSGSNTNQYKANPIQKELFSEELSFVKSDERAEYIPETKKVTSHSSEKTIERIVIFYSDKTFTEYIQESK